MSLRGLEDKVFIITGGAEGLGIATAERLLAEGARVAVVDGTEALVEEALATLGSDRSIGIVADAGEEADVDRYFKETTDRLGKVDGLYNNATAGGPPTPLTETSAEDFVRHLAGNTVSTFLGVRAMLRTASRAESTATVVNASSGAALRGIPGLGAFAASKLPVLAITQTAAIEGAPRIRVNAVVSGPFETPALAADPPEFNEIILSRVPLARFGKPAEAAALVAWLLSEESSYVTGASYVLDGGESVT